MSNDEDDTDLLRAWREEARETPGELLDRRILKAAEAHRLRRRILPLAAGMAACLVLAFHLMRPQEAVAPASAPVAQLDPSTIGLYEGRGAGAMGDPESMQRIMLRHTPAIATEPTAFSP